jgi:Tol biopolymer transport system component
MMTPERWATVERLYHEALTRSANERQGFLAEACAGDDALRREVESLLDHDGSAAFLSTPAAVQAMPSGSSLVGQAVGPYVISARIGAGGMGEVYRARDQKLGRDVAIKILPAAFTSDPDRLARFAREARVLAALNHPHIGAIYGLEDAGPVRALVLELVDGPTVADRIERGRIPMAEALTIARQIADGLEAAHEKGIVHRDLKPANIKITATGVVKVLDFGLAKAATVGTRAELSQSPTITVSGTHEGVLLGTAAYMSPEQARGQAVDKRTDIWSFGCVLYEMLAGRAAFAGETVSDTIAAILGPEPDWRALPEETPVSVRRLLQRCLEKDLKRRLHDMGDAGIDIDEAVASPTVEAASTGSRARGRERVAWALVAIAVLAAGALATRTMLYVGSSAPESVVTRLEVVTPSTPDSGAFALSPDGRQIVFIARADDRPKLWLRPLDQTAGYPLIGTDGASYPFWAPDGRAIGFFADGYLKRIDLPVGVVQVLANASSGRGGTWNQEGTIVFSPTSTGGLMRVSATGGTPVVVTQPASGQGAHRWPQFLPDGRRFLFTVGVGRPDLRGVFVGSLAGDVPKRVVADESAAVYAPPHWLLVVRQGVLMALRFDATRALVNGDPTPVAQDVGDAPGLYHSSFSVSTNGVLAHRPGGGQRRQLVWMDRAGRVLGTVGESDYASLANPSLAPDDQRVAVNRVVQGDIDVWLMDTARGILSRFTFAPTIENLPLWSRDGRRVAFRSTHDGPYDLFEKPASGEGNERVLLKSAETKAPLDWSPDGGTLLYATLDPKTGTADLWALPTVGERKPYPVVRTSFDEANGQFSPDGKWLAYESNESGRFEIYVRPFPGPGSKLVSTAGGSQPSWRRDGKELFYVATDAHMMAIPIGVGSDGQLQADAPVALFAVRLASGANVFGPGGAARSQYAVASDGRFLMNVALDETSPPPIALVLNWYAGLKK